jgi:DNA modification methylase
LTTKIHIDSIVVGDRARKEMGDVPSMVASIREFGLIQPIVLATDNDLEGGANGSRPILIAGGRRLAALRVLGITELEHATHWVGRAESDKTEEGKLRLKSMELEENLRRKDMTWPEIVAAKQKLLEIMELIHGQQNTGGLTREERRTGVTEGFGVRKLAAMLGESLGTVSQDLQLAQMVRAMPQLAQSETKSNAMRTGVLQLMVGVIQRKEAEKKVQQAAAVAAGTAAPQVDYVLYEGPFQSNTPQIPNASVDLVYTDLPYGVNLDLMDGHTGGGILSYEDTRKAVVDMLPLIALESHRILRDDRFAVFWFGFNYYTELVIALRAAGFHVNPVPVVWLKHRNSAANPLRFYASAYEQALVASKGQAHFIRPGQPNLVDIPAVVSAQRVQNAQQPVELVERFIQDMTLPASTIVDLCAGVGTTGVAALRLGRKVVLFEKDPTMCLLIKSRMDGTSI